MCGCEDSICTALLVITYKSKQQLQRVIIAFFLLNSKSKKCRHELTRFLQS